MFEFFPVEKEIQQRQKCFLFPSYIKVLHRDPAPILGISRPAPVFISARYKEFAEKVKEFPIKKHDIWIASYPKTGTTMTSELLRILRYGLNDEEDIYTRVPLIEFSAITDTRPIDLLSIASSLPEPRVIKTHLHVNLLPKDLLISTAKIIYVVRNPKDTAISFYHHHINVNCWQNSDMTVFLEDFLTGTMIFGSYFSHAEEYLRLAKLLDNILVVKYEDMVTDMKGTVSTISQFLDMSLTNEELSSIADYMHFDKMKMRQNSNMEHVVSPTRQNQTGFRFLRKGKIGSFEEEMPQNFHEKFDEELKKWKNFSEYYQN